MPSGGLTDFDGDDLPGITEPDLDALADDLGAAAAGHGASNQGGTLVQQRAIDQFGQVVDVLVAENGI